MNELPDSPLSQTLRHLNGLEWAAGFKEGYREACKRIAPKPDGAPFVPRKKPRPICPFHRRPCAGWCEVN
jgi:hypothetical protein